MKAERNTVNLFLYKKKSNYGREHNKLFPEGGRIREGKVNLLQKEYNTLVIQIIGSMYTYTQMSLSEEEKE